MPEPEKVIPTARHEPTDIGEGFIWGAVASLGALLLGCALLVVWLYPQSRFDRTLEPPLPLYPAPGLQRSPPKDMEIFYAQEMRQLNGTGWVDQAHGVVHIPITEAMRKIAREGIPGWPAAREAAPAGATPESDGTPESGGTR